MFTDFDKVRQIIDLHTCIQGEGKFTGVPHLLIRLSGCNLGCMFSEWLCDTAYASWKPESGKYNLNDVLKLISDNTQINHTFITGGEPTIHPVILREIVNILKANGHFVAIETNGTSYVDCNIDFVTMSPKLSNSIPIPGTMIKNDIVDRLATIEDRDKQSNGRYRPDSLLLWMEHKDYQFKFVCTTDEQLNEIEQIKTRLNIPKDHIYLMPEGVTAEQLQRRRPWLIEKCIERGYNYTDRLHIVAYDNKRIA